MYVNKFKTKILYPVYQQNMNQKFLINKTTFYIFVNNIMEIDFDNASIEWNNNVHRTLIRQKCSKIPWHKSRCGYLKDDGTQCLKPSHFSQVYKREHPVIDVDECDLKFYCYNHKKYAQIDSIKQRILMEKMIIERLKTQQDLFVSDLVYVEKLKEKYEFKLSHSINNVC